MVILRPFGKLFKIKVVKRKKGRKKVKRKKKYRYGRKKFNWEALRVKTKDILYFGKLFKWAGEGLLNKIQPHNNYSEKQ